MPRTVGQDLKDHFGESVTTLAHLWIITRRDSTVFRFTNHSEPITYGGNTYQSLHSQEMSSIDQKTDMSVDNLDFESLLNDSSIKYDDLVGGKFDLAEVEIYVINYEDTTMGVMALISGTFGNVQIHDDISATFEFRSLTQKLSQGIGRVYTDECDADFCDSRCGLTIATYTVTGTITAVTDNQYFNDSGRSEATDHFNYGLLTWTSGLNNGLSMEVKDYDGDAKRFQLVNSMPFTIQVGDTYSVFQGCDKRFETCETTFNNAINFRGFPLIPGMDQIHRIPDLNPEAGMHGGGF